MADALIDNAKTDTEMAEYIQYIIDNPHYIMPIEKPGTVSSGFTGLSKARCQKIENQATEVRNNYHTAMLREQLVTLFKTKPK